MDIVLRSPPATRRTSARHLLSARNAGSRLPLRIAINVATTAMRCGFAFAGGRTFCAATSAGRFSSSLCTIKHSRHLSLFHHKHRDNLRAIIYRHVIHEQRQHSKRQHI